MIQEEVIDMEDLKTGVSITDLGLNDFRMDLLNYMKTNADIGNLPSGLHAVVPADPTKGLYPGVIFTLRNRNHAVNINKQNRLHPFYLLYMGNDGKAITNHTEVKQLLDLARAACRDKPNAIPEAYGPFNAATDDGRDMSLHSGLLAQAIRTIVDVKEDKDLDSLFTGKTTTALTNTIAGLDDFELLSFLVIQEVK